MSRAARIPRGPRSALATALCAVATGSSVLALTGLMTRGGWLFVTWAVVLLVAAVVAGVRAISRAWWAPTLTGLVVSVAVLLVRYGAPPGRIQVLPDLGSLDRTLAAAREGVAVINASLVPMTSVRPTELLVVVGALAVFLLTDLLAVGLGLTAWAGAPLVALWVPAIVLGFPASGWALAWTGLAYLLLLALSASPAGARTDGGRRTSVAVLSSVGVIVVTLVVGPVIAALPGWASLRLPDFGTGPVGPLQLSDNLDLRESLGTRSGQVVLRYTVTPTDLAEGDGADVATPTPDATAAPDTVTARFVGPLRAFTLTSFDGRTWAPDDGDGADLTEIDPATLLTSDPTILDTPPDPARGTLADVSLDVGSLRERHLPVSTFPRTVQARGGWGYDEVRDEVVGRRSTFDGMQYTMTVEVPDLTASDLEDADVGDPGDDGASLELPPTEHADDIADLARTITEDAESPYERALALQSYFRAASNFTYDTRVAPARSSDAVWDFLQSRRGYCVQFATSMAMMARSLGIPARVGVGFLPGDDDGNGTYVVTGRKSHAWPELYFAGQGWVRFEPTPAVQTGAPPIWSDPFTNISAPGSQPTEAAPSGVVPSVAPTRQNSSPGAANETQQGVDWVTIGVVSGIALVVVTGALTLARRRTRTRADLTPERAWVRARRRLAARGVTWSDATTPRGVVDSVQDQLRTSAGTTLTGPPEQALVALARTVERERYAPQVVEFDPAELDRWVDEVVDGVERLLKEGSPVEDESVSAE